MKPYWLVRSPKTAVSVRCETAADALARAEHDIERGAAQAEVCKVIYVVTRETPSIKVEKLED